MRWVSTQNVAAPPNNAAIIAAHTLCGVGCSLPIAVRLPARGVEHRPTRRTSRPSFVVRRALIALGGAHASPHRLDHDI